MDIANFNERFGTVYGEKQDFIGADKQHLQNYGGFGDTRDLAVRPTQVNLVHISFI